MPLSDPVSREQMHTRAITYRGYKREDGLWDIEGHLTDTKAYPVDNAWRNKIQTGEPIHEMLLRVTIDDKFEIRDIEAVTDNSPFQMCPNITPNYKSLVGVVMGAGWRRAVRQKVGGTEGCTHITELLFSMATAAIQTVMPFKVRNNRDTGDKEKGRADENTVTSDQARAKKDKPFVIDSCHAWASDSLVVKKHQPDFYTGSD